MSVSLGEWSGGETPPHLAAETATLPFKGAMREKNFVAICPSDHI